MLLIYKSIPNSFRDTANLLTFMKPGLSSIKIPLPSFFITLFHTIAYLSRLKAGGKCPFIALAILKLTFAKLVHTFIRGSAAKRFQRSCLFKYYKTAYSYSQVRIYSSNQGSVFIQSANFQLNLFHYFFSLQSNFISLAFATSCHPASSPIAAPATAAPPRRSQSTCVYHHLGESFRKFRGPSYYTLTLAN